MDHGTPFPKPIQVPMIQKYVIFKGSPNETPLSEVPAKKPKLRDRLVMEDDEVPKSLMMEEYTVSESQPQPTRRYCNVAGCLVNSVTHPECQFFKLPTDPPRRSVWLKLLKRQDLQDRLSVNFSVCEKHFKEEDMRTSDSCKALQKDALPSLMLPQTKNKRQSRPSKTQFKHRATQVNGVTVSSYAQTTPPVDKAVQVETETVVEYANKIGKELEEIKRKLKLNETQLHKKTEDQFKELCQLLPKRLAKLLKNQPNLKPGSKGNRYSVTQKVFSLNLYFTSKNAYRMIEKDFCLPCMSTLQYINVPVTTHISDDVYTALEMKVKNMSITEKYCAIVVDRLRLKGNMFFNTKIDRIHGFHEVDGVQASVPAKYALFLLARGLYVDWTQPIGFAFLSETKATHDVSQWLDKVLANLLEIGLRVKAYIPTQTTDLLDEANIRGVNVDQPYFYINNEKIYYFYNVSNLMTELRNTFLVNDFCYKTPDGSDHWPKIKFVKEFYAHEKEKQLRMAPKLTGSHLEVEGPGHDSVRAAVQVFSRAVAAALAAYVDHHLIDKEARDTVHFLLAINDLFDVLNSSAVCDDPLKTAFTADSRQIDVLTRSLQLFQSLRVIPNSKTMSKVKFVEGFQVTIKSLLNLFQDLQVESDEPLSTNRLNLEVAEKFKKVMLSRGDTIMELTCHLFELEFRKQFAAHLVRGARRGEVRCRELTCHLVRTSDCIANDEDSDDASSTMEDLTNVCFKDFHVSETVTLHEVCSYLLMRCRKDKLCRNIKTFENLVDNLDKSKYDSTPVKRLFGYIMMLEDEFQKAFRKVYDMKESKIMARKRLTVAALVLQAMADADLTAPSRSFPADYVQRLFIKLRFYIAAEYNNGVYRMNNYNAETFEIPELKIPQ